ncbi:amidase, partial [Streptomyces sp. ME02-8801-2C]|uniref:tectonin domain-containing protein n=1 Tax=Streptomyces sp. ME02-8801-2C TaxID=3028680 RepID=UPI0029B5F39B
NSAGQIWTRAQTSIGGGWSSWVQLDGGLTQVAAETNADGRIELFGVNSAGQVWHRSQSTPGGGWASWIQFDGALRP